jgi:L-malate glycosyltransferase
LNSTAKGQRRHILFILPYLERGGTERHVLSLVNGLRDRYQISLLAPVGMGSDLFQHLGDRYFKFERLDFNLVNGLTQFQSTIRQIQRSQPIDLVHVHGAHEFIFLAKLGLGFKSIPILFTVHGYHGQGTEFSYRAACWFINRFAQGAIAVCEAEKAILIEKGIDSQKLNLIYNGVAAGIVNEPRSQQLATQFKLDPQQQIIIGTAARLYPAKGLRYLIQAFAQLKNERELRLVIAGTGELEAELKQLCLDLEISEQVIFAGYLDNLPDLLELFTIFVLPSLQEACSLACAEAMAQKKAVVGTNVGGISEQVSDGETGFIVPPQDVAALAAKLSTLIAEPELIARFGKNGSDRYQQLFTLEKMLEKTISAYDALFGWV